MSDCNTCNNSNSLGQEIVLEKKLPELNSHYTHSHDYTHNDGYVFSYNHSHSNHGYYSKCSFCYSGNCEGDCRVRFDRDGKPYYKSSCKKRRTHGCYPKYTYSCNKCNYSPCQCNASYYNHGNYKHRHHSNYSCSPKPSSCKTVQHLQPIIESKFSPIIKSNGRAVLPEVDSTNVLHFPGTSVLPEGAILYDADIGYIEIVSFDTASRLATFRNSSAFVGLQVLNVGEYIPDCTEWLVGIPAYGTALIDDGSCCLELDIIVPPLNSQIYASFSSTDCFGSGDGIRIDGQVFTVVSILSSTQALLENLDAANEVGREIIAKDNCQECLHKVVVVNDTISDRVDECITRDGTTVVPIANLDMANFQHINAAPADAPGEYVTFEQFAWDDWTPVISAPGAMSVANTVINHAKYQVINNIVHFKIDFATEVGGTLESYITFTLPLANNGDSVGGGATVVDGGNIVGGFYSFSSLTQFDAYRYDAANFTAGQVIIIINGFYEIA